MKRARRLGCLLLVGLPACGAEPGSHPDQVEGALPPAPEAMAPLSTDPVLPSSSEPLAPGVMNGPTSSEQGDFGSVTWHETPSVAFPDVPALTAEEAFRFVSEHAGASLFRDAVDDYVLTELASLGTRGATISDETSLGLPNVVGELPVAQAPADSDGDGMPDAWEQQNGLDPSNADDRNGDLDGDRYTNLEEYLNSLVP